MGTAVGNLLPAERQIALACVKALDHTQSRNFTADDVLRDAIEYERLLEDFLQLPRSNSTGLFYGKDGAIFNSGLLGNLDEIPTLRVADSLDPRSHACSTGMSPVSPG
ncbi:MAG: hypothetical protein AAFQ11_07265, partial [Pseudomonadota bacterium]